MGTPQFAVPGLRALHETGYDISLVVTQPDRPKGRGRKVTPSPVKAAAMDLGIQVVQPVSIKTAEFRHCLWKNSSRKCPGHTPFRNNQHSCLTAARPPRSRTDSMGHYQWRKANRYNLHADG